MNPRPIRLSVVLTHPIQYYAPWFRHVAARCPEIDLTVLYAIDPTSAQQGVGFGVGFKWDIPLTEGYPHRFARPARPGDDLDSESFRGVDAPEIVPLLRESRPDVVLVPGWHSVTLVRALVDCRRRGVPVLYRGDSHLAGAPRGWRRVAWRAHTRLLLGLYDGFLSVGSRAREYLTSFGIGPERIFDSPHCVDNAFFAAAARPHQTEEGRRNARRELGIAPEEAALLYAGKLTAVKRPLDLVHAAALLERPARVLFAGGGPLESAIRAEAERLGVRVSWAGFVNQRDLGRLYAAADCLVLPGRETWGLVVNEAMATGLPCVVGDGAGCAPDLVRPGETGEVFATGDARSLAAAVERLDGGRRNGLDFAGACRARAERHSFERAGSGLVEAARAAAAPRVLACCGAMVSVSGRERATFEVLRVAAERGAKVHCVLNDWSHAPIAALAEQIGASWSTAPYRARIDRGARNPWTAARLAWESARASLSLWRAARRLRATRVLVAGLQDVLRSAPALAWLRRRGVPVVLRVANPPEAGRRHAVAWRVAAAFVDELVCNSDFTMRELLACGVARRKVRRIYNAVPTRADGAAPPSRDVRKIVYAGQIIPQKGADLLLDAVGLLVRRGYDPRLDVIGGMNGWEAPAYAGFRERLRARAAEADLAERVSFLGWREDVPSLMSGAAVHCCPSRPEQREGFGIVVLEAKQAGIPSVVTPTGALPEVVVHGVDGFVCGAANTAALADGLEHFLADRDRCEEAGRAARASLERFDRRRFADAWWNVLAGRRRGAGESE